MKLSDLLSYIGQAGAEASLKAARHSHQRLMHMFHVVEKDGVKSLVPKDVEIEIAGRKVNVPEIILSRVGGLDLKTLVFEIETDVYIDSKDLNIPKEEKEEIPVSSVQVGLKRGLFRRNSHAKITAEFEMGPPPEGISQIEDKLNETLRADMSSANE